MTQRHEQYLTQGNNQKNFKKPMRWADFARFPSLHVIVTQPRGEGKKTPGLPPPVFCKYEIDFHFQIDKAGILGQN